MADLARDCIQGNSREGLLSYWNSLKIQSGVLYKRWETPNLNTIAINKEITCMLNSQYPELDMSKIIKS